MTHTLHRHGDTEGLKNDYILMILADRKINLEGSQEKMREIWKIISRYEKDLANFGNLDGGNSHETTLHALIRNEENQYAHAVFKNREALKACLRDIRERDFGLSVIVSGLCAEVEKICKEIGLPVHTVEISLGVWGVTERLPEKNVLEMTTMCGHHMVSPQLVDRLIGDLKENKISYPKAAAELSRLCGCGIFNPCRAETLLKKAVEEPTGS